MAQEMSRSGVNGTTSAHGAVCAEGDVRVNHQSHHRRFDPPVQRTADLADLVK